jgi:rsbT co-antagonist protein RsbR
VATRLPEILKKYEGELLTDWLREQKAAGVRPDLINDVELRDQSSEFLRLFREATAGGNVTDIQRADWAPVREMLTRLSRTRGLQGFSSSETATFLFSAKQPIFARMRKELGGNTEGLLEEVLIVSALLDKLGLFTTEAHLKAREELINRQQQAMLELSTPVVELYRGILALPLIGTLDSNRTQTVMESLLARIVETGSETAIIDITGVPTVDTLTAQHLLKTVTATRLMGADCIISGIRPQIAQTIVHLGVDLGDVTTKASLAGAFALALQRSGLGISKVRAPAPGVIKGKV